MIRRLGRFRKEKSAENVSALFVLDNNGNGVFV